VRLDKFLKVMAIIKRRTVANEAANEGFILINGKSAKPSSTVKQGDVLEIDMWNYYKKITIIDVPSKNSVPKKDREKYIRTDEYKPKEPDDII